MNRITRTTVAFSFLLFSCKQSGNDFQATPGTPEALREENKSGISLSKGRANDDLVEGLYAELLVKNPELAELEKTIENLDDQKRDSIEIFNVFNQKNTSYYNSAERYSAGIKDSLLRRKIKTIIDNSKNNYDRRIAANEHLISILDVKEKTLEDLHVVLKLAKTLPIIDKYQADNKPSVKPVENVIRHFDKSIKQADTLAWK
jgi:hypothetical protein